MLSFPRRPTATAVLAAAMIGAGAVPAAAQEAPAERSVAAEGLGITEVRAPRERTEATIREAVRVAERAALAEAVARARERAAALAEITGLRLGEIRSVEEAPNGSFFSLLGFEDEEFSTAPPYCRTERRSVRRGGRRRTVRRRVCRVPEEAAALVKVTFRAS